jgi:hypothetical protein
MHHAVTEAALVQQFKPETDIVIQCWLIRTDPGQKSLPQPGASAIP